MAGNERRGKRRTDSVFSGAAVWLRAGCAVDGKVEKEEGVDGRSSEREHVLVVVRTRRELEANKGRLRSGSGSGCTDGRSGL